MSTKKAAAPRPKSKWRPFDYCMDYLRQHKRASYGEVRELAMPRKWRNVEDFSPVVYGRALAILGLVPVKRRKAKAA